MWLGTENEHLFGCFVVADSHLIPSLTVKYNTVPYGFGSCLMWGDVIIPFGLFKHLHHHAASHGSLIGSRKLPLPGVLGIGHVSYSN